MVMTFLRPLRDMSFALDRPSSWRRLAVVRGLIALAFIACPRRGWCRVVGPGLLTLVASACTPPEEASSTVIDPASLVLPHSSTGEAALEELPTVIVTKTKLVLSGVPRASVNLPLGFESMSGPIIEPLRGWLKEAKLTGGEMAVAADSGTKSDVVMEVMATCMDAGYATFHVAVSREGATAQIPLSFGKPDPPNAQWLTASVFNGGVVVKVAAGTLGPGCDGLGNGVTISRVDGVIDRVALAKCVSRAHKQYQTNAASVLVTKDTVFSDVVTLLDAMRHDAETASIALGISS
jgi:hypothetical protein